MLFLSGNTSRARAGGGGGGGLANGLVRWDSSDDNSPGASTFINFQDVNDLSTGDSVTMSSDEGDQALPLGDDIHGAIEKGD